MLANATINGQTQKVVYKGCKNGYMYALDAQTGKMLWVFNPPSIARPPYSQLYDPRDRQSMVKPWENYPSLSPVVQNPSYSGAIESNPAYDPSTNTLFVGVFNGPIRVVVTCVNGRSFQRPCPGGYGAQGVSNTCCDSVGPENTTIWALDASTGKPKW